MKKLFKLLLNVALAAVSYTDLGGKAQHRTSPDPMHHASTLRGILPLHPVISACGPLHTHRPGSRCLCSPPSWLSKVCLRYMRLRLS